MKVTGPQMVLTMKLTTFAKNVFDGRRKAEVRVVLYVSGQLLKNSRIQELDKWQLSKRITKYPSILEFLGYSYVAQSLFFIYTS